MAKPRVKAVIDYFELPHLFGFWIQDPIEVEWRAKTSGAPWLPHAWLFYAETVLVELDFVEGDDGKTDVSRARYAAYELDGPKMFLQMLNIDDDGEVQRGDASELPWFMSDDGRLNVKEEGDSWFRYIPANIDDLVAAGFDRDLIEFVLEDTRTQSDEIIEIFTDAKARELIAEKIRREDEEHGF